MAMLKPANICDITHTQFDFPPSRSKLATYNHRPIMVITANRKFTTKMAINTNAILELLGHGQWSNIFQHCKNDTTIGSNCPGISPGISSFVPELFS